MSTVLEKNTGSDNYSISCHHMTMRYEGKKENNESDREDIYAARIHNSFTRGLYDLADKCSYKSFSSLHIKMFQWYASQRDIFLLYTSSNKMFYGACCKTWNCLLQQIPGMTVGYRSKKLFTCGIIVYPPAGPNRANDLSFVILYEFHKSVVNSLICVLFNLAPEKWENRNNFGFKPLIKLTAAIHLFFIQAHKQFFFIPLLQHRSDTASPSVMRRDENSTCSAFRGKKRHSGGEPQNCFPEPWSTFVSMYV